MVPTPGCPPKPKYTEVKEEELGPQMIRACIDMRIPNELLRPSVKNRIICFTAARLL